MPARLRDEVTWQDHRKVPLMRAAQIGMKKDTLQIVLGGCRSN